VEATIDTAGGIHLLEKVTLPQARRAFVTILEEPPVNRDETALLSESALAVDWNRPEEYAAWSHLQSAE